MEDYVQFLFLGRRKRCGRGGIYEHTLKKKKGNWKKNLYQNIYVCLELYVFYINSMLFVIFPIRI